MAAGGVDEEKEELLPRENKERKKEGASGAVHGIISSFWMAEEEETHMDIKYGGGEKDVLRWIYRRELLIFSWKERENSRNVAHVADQMMRGL